MEKFIQRENVTLYRKRLAEPRTDAEHKILVKLLADEEAKDVADVMNRKGVEFTLLLIGPGLWKWRFQVGDAVLMGKTKTSLMGMAARRVHQRIDRELRKPRPLGPR